MQPYLFPYIGYFQLIQTVDRFVLLDDVNYINKGWINRNRILVNGKEHTFTIPLRDASQNKLIKDVAIANDSKWRSKFLKTVEMAYRKAPHYDVVQELVKTVINSEAQMISEMIEASLRQLTGYLGISTTIVGSSADYQIKDSKGEERILDICRLEKAQHYINLIGGKELYSTAVFSDAGIKLSFLKSKLTAYDQAGARFVPGLSIIDVMMFNSPEQIREMLKDYELE